MDMATGQYIDKHDCFQYVELSFLRNSLRHSRAGCKIVAGWIQPTFRNFPTPVIEHVFCPLREESKESNYISYIGKLVTHGKGSWIKGITEIRHYCPQLTTLYSDQHCADIAGVLSVIRGIAK